MHELPSANLVGLITGLPLLGFLIHAFFGKLIITRMGEDSGKRVVGGLATALVLASFGVSLYIFSGLLSMEGEHKRAFASLVPFLSKPITWIDIAGFKVSFGALVDPLSILMCLIVTGIGGLIHLYATGYMAKDKDYARFFTYMNLFIFFMLVLVLADNILLMFVGWEGVGLCSYLLISFWYEDTENSKAGNKAFIVNRIGDVGYALGIMAIFAFFGTLTFYTEDGKGFLDAAINGKAANGFTFTPELAMAIGLLLFVGACGKSAQFPLHVWLPDAMAGPTPVSALIHAATMVTAGVVMLTRMSPIIVKSETTLLVIAAVGLFTALFAATIALTQNDIKKVLAYSTVSQLGYMFLGCGAGAFGAGMFHVTTHAFFKALLFLGAGSVIHAMHHEQDMRRMGGLSRKIKVTYVTMLAGWIAICGIPPFAGFWSKDEILGYASGIHSYGLLFYAVGLVTAALTAFYMSRLMWKTFWSDQRYDEATLGARGHGGDAHNAHHDHGGDAHDTHGAEEHAAGVKESPQSMLIPLVILAALSLLGGFIGTPFNNFFEHFLEPSVAKFEAHHGVSFGLGAVLGTMVAAIGIGLAYSLYSKRRASGELLPESQKAGNPLYQASANLWYVDRFFYDLFVIRGGNIATALWRAVDQNIIDGLVNAVAGITGLLSELFRRLQTGYIRAYALSMLTGVVLVVIALLWSALRTMGK
jgi:NADH-quinone oxidoreductase subunit L